VGGERQTNNKIIKKTGNLPILFSFCYLFFTRVVLDLQSDTQFSSKLINLFRVNTLANVKEITNGTTQIYLFVNLILANFTFTHLKVGSSRLVLQRVNHTMTCSSIFFLTVGIPEAA